MQTLSSLFERKLPREHEIIKQDFEREYAEVQEKALSTVYRGERKVVWELDGRIIRKAIFHPRKERPFGVDLGIEFEGEKVILYQVKVKRGGRFHIPRDQLLRAIRLCAQLCRCPFPPILEWSLRSWTPPCRGSVFYKFSGNGIVEILNVCEVAFILGSRKSASAKEFRGIPEDEFSSMVWKCNVGCGDLPRGEKDELFRLYTLQANRLLILYEITDVSELFRYE